MATQTSGGLEKEERFRIVAESQKHGMSEDETMDYYRSWAISYEEDLEIVGYQAPALAAEYLAKQNPPKDGYIMDIAAGTGWCARLLKEKYGYSNFDALDASQDMLDIAKARGLYKNLYCLFIGEGRKIPIADNTYDHITLAGGLVSGHIKLDAFEELVRIVKPGGFIVVSMRAENRTKVPEYVDLDEVFAKYEAQGLWQKVEEVTTKNYYMDLDGLVLVYKVTKS